ncbi:MAG TPA: hypothetical protein HPP87_09570 [Planctomycetes bacterium]|nr:hypothetical protein [Planctomycetota bacterium]HIJ71594.1 hypothetical protein [Planctomycetota bacterium]
MGLISSGIERVMSCSIPAGVRADGSSVDEPLSVLVRWRSGYEDKLYQIYVNGALAGVAANPAARQMIVPIPAHTNSAVRIEVFAVEASAANVDFSSELQSHSQSGRVKLSWPRGMNLPFEGTAQVYSDGGGGEINYDEPVSKEDIRLWPSRQDKVGFGSGPFADGDFGYDGSSAIGFGKGAFGEGEFGFDADEMSWISGELETGKYRFAVKVQDRFGNVSEAQETDKMTVIRTAKPAQKLEVESYDKGESRLKFMVK